MVWSWSSEQTKEIAKDKNFESLIHTLQEMLAHDSVEISEEQFESLKRILSEHKKELGLDSKEK